MKKIAMTRVYARRVGLTADCPTPWYLPRDEDRRGAAASMAGNEMKQVANFGRGCRIEDEVR